MGRRARGRFARLDIVTVSVAQFALAALAALVIVALATGIASRRVGEREAIANARTITVLKAQSVVEPAITTALWRGDDDAIEQLDELVRAEVLDDSLVRVKIWTADGEILYSDAAALIGSTYDLGDDELDALATGRIQAEVSDLAEPENRFERDFGTLLEVYLPIGGHGDGTEPLLFEAYYRYEAVRESGSQLWRSFAPIALGGLVVLQLVQIPLAWSLARRLRDRLREREALTWRALEASEIERRQIASDLHDGVVQQLTGVAFALSAAAREPAGSVGPADLDAAAADVRGAVRSLRSLVVDLAPVNLQEEGLVPALEELAGRVAGDGLAVDVEAPSPPPTLSADTARLLYRAALEGLRNVARHAGARRATVRLRTDGGSVVLSVEDDGRGFDPGVLPAAAGDGHVGLRALRGVVADAGGTLQVVSRPGAGTTLEIQVPVP